MGETSVHGKTVTMGDTGHVRSQLSLLMLRLGEAQVRFCDRLEEARALGEREERRTRQTCTVDKEMKTYSSKPIFLSFSTVSTGNS